MAGRGRVNPNILQIEKQKFARKIIIGTSIASIVLFMVLGLSYHQKISTLTGFSVFGGVPAFSADFEQGRQDKTDMPAGFYLKGKYHMFYDPDADDINASYEVADKRGQGLHGNAMLFDSAQLVDPKRGKDEWVESATIPVEPEKQYALSFSEKYLGPADSLDYLTVTTQQFDKDYNSIYWDDSANFNAEKTWSNSQASTMDFQKQGEWTTITVKFTTLPGAQHIRFRIYGYYSENYGRDKALIDDFVLS